MELDARLKHPFNMMVCGPTQSGKTTWVGRLLTHSRHLLEQAPQRVFWHSPHDEVWTPPSSLRLEIIHRRNVPWAAEEGAAAKAGAEPGWGDLVVIDDFGQEISNSRELTAHLTKYSHHRGVSVIVLLQNLFWSGKEARTQSLNMHYIVLLRQSRDHKQIRTLARQLTPDQAAYSTFVLAYNDATGKRNFSYLLVSMHPRDDRRLLLRSNIFPEDATSPTVYLPPLKKV